MLPVLWYARDMSKPAWIGLGTAISHVTRRLGIPECPGCRGRREILDRFVPRIWPSRARPPSGASTPASSSPNGLSTEDADAARKWAQGR